MPSVPPKPTDSILTTLVLDVPSDGADERDTLIDETSSGELSDTAPAGRLTDRYEDLGPIGTGGMGQVRRVRDLQLNRVLAMKLVHARLIDRPAILARFVEEAQATAQLQHPGIVPVHEIGRLDDGRAFFTMREVQGRTLAHVITLVHGAARDGHWEPAAGGWTFRRLIASLHAACRAVGYAHARGVLHRDIKPDNVMVGEHGEVYVVDWGLAKVLGRVELPADFEDATDTSQGSVVTDRSLSDANATRLGTIAGTPAYMAPEQARGQTERIDARSDVYALGAVLYEVLCGHPPYTGDSAKDVLREALRRPPSALDPESAAAPIPAELIATCSRAMAIEPGDRFPTAEALADELEAWIDGARRRERALSIVARAHALAPEAQAMREQALVLESKSLALLEDVEPWRPEEDKAGAWAMRDQAGQLLQDAELKQLEVDQVLQAALQLVPDLPEAHEALALRFRDRQAAAEQIPDRDAAAMAEAQLRHHALSLHPDHPTGRACSAWLVGDGALTLVTDPPGAEVLLHRYTLRNRRLVPTFERSLGATPLHEVALPMGSYLCLLKHPERAQVRYPVSIGRLGHWDGVAPNATEPHPIWLPGKGAIDPDTAYVPAGWFDSGGDPAAFQSHPRRRVWVDAFLADRFAVTNRQYIQFLDSLVLAGEPKRALQHAPSERAGAVGESGAQIFDFDGDNFWLKADADGDLWDLDWPVMMIDWHSARAYLAWKSEQTGQTWRLPAELEREKAARGVDGRWFPWGNHFDASWCRMTDSHRGSRTPSVVDSYPTDASVYDLRGVGANVGDWCLDPYIGNGPTDLRTARVVRGGSWQGASRSARCANRLRHSAAAGDSHIGLRGFSSLGPQTGVGP